MIREIIGEELIERARNDTINVLFSEKNRVNFKKFWVVLSPDVIKIFGSYNNPVFVVSLSDPDLASKVRNKIKELLDA